MRVVWYVMVLVVLDLSTYMLTRMKSIGLSPWENARKARRNWKTWTRAEELGMLNLLAAIPHVHPTRIPCTQPTISRSLFPHHFFSPYSAFHTHVSYSSICMSAFITRQTIRQTHLLTLRPSHIHYPFLTTFSLSTSCHTSSVTSLVLHVHIHLSFLALLICCPLSHMPEVP